MPRGFYSYEEVAPTTSPHFTVFPNPASTAFTLQSAHVVDKNTHFILTDAIGRVVLRKKLERGQLSYEMDVGDLERGIYFYSVENLDGVVGVGKVVISR